ncbi:MAG: hypothetical protein MMC33_002171 [Icmadophila ericetorum]|nr:hypothetical protein [Icmadophila ericetorum]
MEISKADAKTMHDKGLIMLRFQSGLRAMSPFENNYSSAKPIIDLTTSSDDEIARPIKYRKLQNDEGHGDSSSVPEDAPKRKRGRPRKDAKNEFDSNKSSPLTDLSSESEGHARSNRSQAASARNDEDSDARLDKNKTLRAKGGSPPESIRPKVLVSLAAIQAEPPSKVRLNFGENLDILEDSHHEFLIGLKTLSGPKVRFVNNVDTTVPENFTFVNEYVFTPGTKRLEEEFRSGCDCRENSGRNMGCEYLTCLCLEDTASRESGKPWGFPYFAVGNKKGCLRDIYLNSRNAIYECNELCRCGASCKNRVVQKGRQIEFEIFKTRDRGFGRLEETTPPRELTTTNTRHPGLRSPVPIRKGQFIDTYLGEVITDSEATRRESLPEKGPDSYLYSLDKFCGEKGSPDYIPRRDLYVVDGSSYSNPTRFMNHSCNPNCRQFAVSLVRGDNKVYELAFFAADDIRAGEELTFNYIDDDDESPISEGEAREISKRMGVEPVRCRCGERTCRRYLWLRRGEMGKEGRQSKLSR